MSLHNNASIAYAVVATARAADDGEQGTIQVGVLSRAPGDGAQAIAREIGSAMRMEVVELRAPQVEYHPGAINAFAHDQFEKAVATGRPVLVLIDEAHGAPAGVLRAIASAISKRVETQPCAVLAISTSAGEASVAEQLAKGFGWDQGRVLMHRTDEENRRLLERVLGAAGD